VRFRQLLPVAVLASRSTLAAVNAAGRTPLHVAVEHGGYPGGGKLLSTLIQCGADVSAADRAGDTPLHLLSQLWKRAAVETARTLIVDGGANVWAANDAGDTPVDVARATAARALRPGPRPSLRPLPQIPPPLLPWPSQTPKEAGERDLIESLALARRRRIGYFGADEANGDDASL